MIIVLFVFNSIGSTKPDKNKRTLAREREKEKEMHEKEVGDVCVYLVS